MTRRPQNTALGLSYYREELDRRARERHDEQIADYTRRMYWLTAIIGAATVVNVALFMWSVLSAR